MLNSKLRSHFGFELQCRDPLLRLHSRFANIDIAVEIPELDFRTAAVNGSTHRLIDLYAIMAALSATVFGDLLGSARSERHVEVADDLAAVRDDYQIGFEVRRKRHIDIAIERAEGHG